MGCSQHFLQLSKTDNQARFELLSLVLSFHSSHNHVSLFVPTDCDIKCLKVYDSLNEDNKKDKKRVFGERSVGCNQEEATMAGILCSSLEQVVLLCR